MPVNECDLPIGLVDVAKRLAHERVPILAIARAFNFSSSIVRQTLVDALYTGAIAEMPPEDWHTSPSKNAQAGGKVKPLEGDALVNACIRFFKITPLQGAFMAVLLVKPDVKKDALHTVSEQRRRPSSRDKRDEADPKMVDVIICNLRKGLKPYVESLGKDPETYKLIQTSWGEGYFIEAADRAVALEKLAEYYESGSTNV